jgi:succinate-semialdehyde dehydrogenase/glutarate-semialdehyde dehydrogenase
MKLQAINPANGMFVAEYTAHTSDQVAEILTTAKAASAGWRGTPIATRATLLAAVAARLRAGVERYANRIVNEMGKPIRQANAEIEKCAVGCEFYANRAEEFLTPQRVASDAGKSYVRFDPLGAVLAVMPWNFPFWQVFRCAAPALMAGNVVLLKHASNVPGCAVAIEEVFREAGLPEGVFRTLLIGSDQTADVIANDFISAISVTGSEAAGAAIAAQAGRHIKKCVLELGGSDPFIVLADADIAHAARQAAAARCQNAGQSCIAAKRFILAEPIAEPFITEMVAQMQRLQVGDPMKAETDIGPLARSDLRDELHGQVTRSLAAGARLRIGGEIPSGTGYFYPPTLLDCVDPSMPVFAEETFGPVAAVMVARDESEAVELANRSRYGLGASIWTRNAQRGEELATGIESGSVFINEIVKSDPRLPFGGVKRSGYGRELSEFGIREFVNVKTVWVA